MNYSNYFLKDKKNENLALSKIYFLNNKMYVY